MKETLSSAALKIRNRLIEAVEKWCNDTVKNIETTFNNMESRIRTVPTNEKELVSIREFIKVSRDVTQLQLQDQLKEAIKHQELLDEFSHFYKEEDIVVTLMQKMWPMQIGNVI